MKTLYLLRHAAAETGETDDHERGLTQGGQLQARRVANWLDAQDNLPEFILSSSSARTLQTARILIDALYRTTVAARVETRFDRRLYLAPTDIVMSEISALDPTVKSVLVVGHNPAIAELAQSLSANTFSDHAQDYATGTLAKFECDIDTWQELSPAHAQLREVFVADA